MFDLRSWLRRAPKPARLRIKTSDDEERIIELGAGRTKWHACEETVRTSGAVSVQALDKDDKILRACRLSEEDLEADDDEDKAQKRDERAIGKERRELAGVLDAYGKRMNDSFLAGAEAAGRSQENLVALVEVLTTHLSLAITNLHNVSVNLANVVQEASGGGDNPNAGLLGQVLALAAGGGQAAPAAPNGRSKKP
jgi:hypothetical protein